jgi:molybdate transport system ATP-binding protein
MPSEPAFAFAVDIELTRGDTRIAVAFSAAAGLTALVGHSGAGKSSVLACVAGLLRPTRGRIVLAGEVVFDSAAGIDLPPQRRACGVVFQDLRLFPHRRVRDNLLYGWRLADPARRFMGLDEAADFLGIGGLLDRWPRTLSGGWRSGGRCWPGPACCCSTSRCRHWIRRGGRESWP